MLPANKDLLYLLRILEAIGKILLYSKKYNTAEDFIFSNHQRDYNASLLLANKQQKLALIQKINFPKYNGSIYMHIDFSKII